jgi:hypothetical protein
LLEQSPSLRNYLTEVFPQIWQEVLTDTRAEYPEGQFPDEWMFSPNLDDLLRQKLW